MNSKTEFQENIFSPKYDFSKSFVFEICRDEKFSIQNKPNILEIFHFKFSLCRKTLAPESDAFFSANFISNSYFQWKICYKVMPLKWARKVKNLLLSAEQIESKRYFLDVMFFIETWFLNINWTQNLSFRKSLSPQNDFPNSILSKSARTKNSRFKNWSFCRKKFYFNVRHFFQKISIQISDFQRKGLLQNHAF